MPETTQTSLGEPILKGFKTEDGWGEFERQAVALCLCGCKEHVDPKRRSAFFEDHYKGWLKTERHNARAAKFCACGCQAHLDGNDGRWSPYIVGHAPKRRSKADG